MRKGSAYREDVQTALLTVREPSNPWGVPNNDLPPLPPKVEIETLPVLRKAISANRALAELKTAGALIPNQAVLIRAIVLQEAKLSSEIENIVTTNDQLYRALSFEVEKVAPPTKEVLRYEAAIWHGFRELQSKKPLDQKLFTEIAATIKEEPVEIRRHFGTRIVNRTTRRVIYAPPEGPDRIGKLLTDLSQYLSKSSPVDSLIKMAVAHYQFEAIHPFPDGNGRTGRVLNVLYLIQEGLLDLPVLYLSKSIIDRKHEYYRGLRRVTEEADWQSWILFMLDAVEDSSRRAKDRILAIRAALEAAIEFAKTNMRRGYHKELIELVFEQPYTRITTLIEREIAQRDTASLYLRELERIGLLTSEKVGRDRIYRNERLLYLLTT